ncbi:DUF1285 domain-containing protein [Maricaulis sp. CAU 1757]
MPPTKQTADPLQSLLDAARRAGDDLPPVEKWNPDYCGEMDLVIRRDGSWWHEGSRITRDRLTRLFSTVLRKDDDGIHYLVTPVEKIAIEVEVAAFQAIRVERKGTGSDQVLLFETNFGDAVAAGPDHPITVKADPETGEPLPLVHVRGRLEALMSRPVYYELADWVETHDGVSGVWSQGHFFALEAADD